MGDVDRASNNSLCCFKFDARRDAIQFTIRNCLYHIGTMVGIPFLDSCIVNYSSDFASGGLALRADLYSRLFA